MYKNLERFVAWLKEASKAEVDEVYIEETLKELEQQQCNNGCQWFELSRFETKSGNPETYSYNVVYEKNEDGYITTIYEF